MCGITAIAKRAAPILDADHAAIARVLDRMAYRGPDGRGSWASRNVLLGHRRLSIIDLSDAGAQPFHDAERDLHLVFNGEIYNYQDLRRELAVGGYRFRTQTDTEVILASYLHWGTACARHLRGMFAFVLYDQQKQLIIICRDRIGKKPLFYLYDDERLIVASEIKAFHAFPSVSLTIDSDSVRSFFALQYIPGPSSIYREVKKLEPGHLLQLDLPSWTSDLSSYWSVGRQVQAPEQQSFTLDRLDQALAESVRYRLIADVEVGILLSGGVDSSLLACYAARESSVPMRAFSVSFAEQDLDESSYAAAVASSLGMEILTVEGGKVDVETFLRIIFHADEPLGDYACLPTFLIARALSSHVKVVLSGEGADELFWGYPHYQREMLWRYLVPPWRRNTSSFWSSLFVAMENEPRTPSFVTRITKVLSTSGDVGGARWTRVFGERALHDLIHDGSSGEENHRDVLWRLMATRSDLADVFRDSLMASLSVDLVSWLPDDLLVKLDRMTMAHSVEARAPFLDQQVVALALAAGRSHKAGPFQTKRALRRLLERKLGKSVQLDIAGRKKHGFEAPFVRWMRRDLREIAEELLSKENLDDIGVLNTEYVRGLWKSLLQVKAPPKPFARKLWLLLCFAAWFKHHRCRFGMNLQLPMTAR